MCQDVLHRIRNVLEVHSLSPATEKSEDDYFGVSDDSGDMEERRFANCYYGTTAFHFRCFVCFWFLLSVVVLSRV